MVTASVFRKTSAPGFLTLGRHHSSSVIARSTLIHARRSTFTSRGFGGIHDKLLTGLAERSR